jgi:hypothetical protein
VAVIVPGPIIADIRGKVGSNTFSRNQGGLYVKANPVWEQPPSELRDQTQYVIKTMGALWASDLSEADRQTWRDYAAANPRPNRWGHRNLHNGYAFWFRANAYVYRDSQGITYTTAPNIPPTGPLPFTIARKGTTADLTITSDNFTFPDTEDTITVYFFDMKPGTLGETGTRGPWKILGSFFLTKGSLPINYDVTPPFPLAANQHRALRCVGQWLASGAFASTSWAQCYT